jgi:uncharacterized membrane protein YtjA (UPF0391 family)
VIECRQVFVHVGFFLYLYETYRAPHGRGWQFANRPRRFTRENLTMLQLAVFLLVVALLAALLGFGGLAGSFVGLAKIVFFVFLVLAVLSFFGGRMFQRGYAR